MKALPRYADGAGYQITIQVFQQVPTGDGGSREVVKEVQVSNVTLKTAQ